MTIIKVVTPFLYSETNKIERLFDVENYFKDQNWAMVDLQNQIEPNT